MISKRMGWVLAVAALLVVSAVGVSRAQGHDPEGEQEENHWIAFLSDGSWLGVQLSDVTSDKAKELKLPGEFGAYVEEVDEDSPAAKAGLKAGDVITSFAGERVRSVAHLRRLVQETPSGRSVAVEVSRDGQKQTLNITPAQRRARFRMPEVRVPEINIPPFEVPNFELQWTRGPRLGISAEELTPQLAEYFGVKQGKGVLVREVMVGSAAAKAGLKAGDVIVRVDDQDVDDVGALREALNRERPTKQATLTIVRERREQTVKVELEEPQRPSPRRVAEALDPQRQAQRQLRFQLLEEHRALQQQTEQLLRQELKQRMEQEKQKIRLDELKLKRNKQKLEQALQQEVWL